LLVLGRDASRDGERSRGRVSIVAENYPDALPRDSDPAVHCDILRPRTAYGAKSCRLERSPVDRPAEATDWDRAGHRCRFPAEDAVFGSARVTARSVGRPPSGRAAAFARLSLSGWYFPCGFLPGSRRTQAAAPDGPRGSIRSPHR